METGNWRRRKTFLLNNETWKLGKWGKSPLDSSTLSLQFTLHRLPFQSWTRPLLTCNSPPHDNRQNVEAIVGEEVQVAHDSLLPRWIVRRTACFPKGSVQASYPVVIWKEFDQSWNSSTQSFTKACVRKSSRHCRVRKKDQACRRRSHPACLFSTAGSACRIWHSYRLQFRSSLRRFAPQWTGAWDPEPFPSGKNGLKSTRNKTKLNTFLWKKLVRCLCKCTQLGTILNFLYDAAVGIIQHNKTFVELASWPQALRQTVHKVKWIQHWLGFSVTTSTEVSKLDSFEVQNYTSKSVKLSHKILDFTECTKQAISQKVQIFDEGCFFTKGEKRVFDWSHLLLFFSFSTICKWLQGRVKVWVQIWDFRKVFEMDIWQRFWSTFCVIRYQV